MTEGNGIFHDGITARPNPVDFNISERSLNIYLPDGRLMNWDLSAIYIHQNFDKTEIKTQQYPECSIELKGQRDFVRNLEEKISQPKFKKYYQRAETSGPLVIVGIFIAVLALLAAGYFYGLPFIAEKSVALVPESFDDRLGASVYESYVSNSDIDSVATKELKTFASAIRFDSPRPLNFTVVKSDEVNAFALPDGNIIVYSGILEKIKSENELAALLSHEASHVINRHSMKLMCRNLSSYLFVSALIGDASAFMAVIAENANMLTDLSYSRGFEQEADLNGLQILRRNNLNEQGMLDLLHHLSEIEGGSVPEFLSTHPVTEHRLKYVKDEVQVNNYKANPVLQQAFKRLKS